MSDAELLANPVEPLPYMTRRYQKVEHGLLRGALKSRLPYAVPNRFSHTLHL
jgi:hypothetical protein